MMSPRLFSTLASFSLGIVILTVCHNAFPRLWWYRRLSTFTREPSSSMLILLDHDLHWICHMTWILTWPRQIATAPLICRFPVHKRTDSLQACRPVAAKMQYVGCYQVPFYGRSALHTCFAVRLTSISLVAFCKVCAILSHLRDDILWNSLAPIYPVYFCTKRWLFRVEYGVDRQWAFVDCMLLICIRRTSIIVHQNFNMVRHWNMLQYTQFCEALRAFHIAAGQPAPIRRFEARAARPPTMPMRLMGLLGRSRKTSS